MQVHKFKVISIINIKPRNMEKNQNFHCAMQDLLNQINPCDIKNEIKDLPNILKLRENILNRGIPVDVIWRKKLALELIMCKAIVAICEKTDANLLLHPEKLSNGLFESEIHNAGFPEGNFDEMLQIFIKETQQFLVLYIGDLMAKPNLIDSKTIYFRSSFLPASISRDVLSKYLKIL